MNSHLLHYDNYIIDDYNSCCFVKSINLDTNANLFLSIFFY